MNGPSPYTESTLIYEPYDKYYCPEPSKSSSSSIMTIIKPIVSSTTITSPFTLPFKLTRDDLFSSRKFLLYTNSQPNTLIIENGRINGQQVHSIDDDDVMGITTVFTLGPIW